MLKVYSVLLMGIIAVSFSPIFIRYCGDTPAIVIVALRLLTASLLVMPWALYKRDSIIRFDKRYIPHTFLSATFLVLHFITWFSSLKHTSVASAMVLVNVSPIFVCIISALLFKEIIGKKLLFSIILSMMGSVIIAFGDGNSIMALDGDALYGDLLALGGAVTFSGYLLMGYYIIPKISLFVYSLLMYIFGTIILIPIVLLTDYQLTGYDNQVYMFILLLAIVPQLIGHTSFNWAMKRLSANVVSIAVLGEIIGATFLAYLILGEAIETYQFVGILFVFSGIFLASRHGGVQNVKTEGE